MKTVFATLLIGAAMLVGCGSDDSGDGSSSGNTSSSSNCDKQYSCVNGSCQCEAGPKKGNSCCDPDSGSCGDDNCNDYCKYCS